MCGELVAAGWAARRLSFRDNGRDALRLQLLTSDAVVLLRRDTADTKQGDFEILCATERTLP
jgi:hypothetical protein